MDVVIVGGGIGGLTAALALHRAGLSAVVHEQAGQVRELGVGLNLLPHAVAELDGLGLLPELDAAAVRIAELTYAHRLGPAILRRPCGLDGGFAHPQFSVHRGRLHGLLLRAVRERLGPDAVRTGHRLTRVEQDADGVRAHFADAAPVEGGVLVAADGIHSAVRSILFPDEGPPRWNGVLMWRGATDWPVWRGGHSMLVAGGTAAKLVVYPVADGATPGTRLTNWAICVRTGRDGDPPPLRQDWSRPADPATLDEHVARFAVPDLDHAALVRTTAEAFEFPMCDRDPLSHWTDGRVTLLGDAAHPMFPMGSNGAGQAILDAVALADRLREQPDPRAALRGYQDRRLPPTGDLVLRNRTGGPERVIDEVERRAPDGFDRLEDVVDVAELDAVVAGYTQASRR